MNDLSINCPLCRSSKTLPYGEKNQYTMKACGECSTVFSFTSAHDGKSELKELYDEYYVDADYELSQATEDALQFVVNSFTEFRKSGRLLDIGFGEGGMLSVSEKNGWECYGTELSPQSLKFGNERGWTVTKDALADPRFPKGEFDVVTMVELIEHVSNPAEFLQTAYECLRPGGILYLTTPNSRSINARVLGPDWSVFAPPEHITLWSPHGAKKALIRSGFEIKRIRTDGFNPIEILRGFRSDQTIEAADRNESAFALNESFNKSYPRRLAKKIVNVGLSFFKIGDGIKVWATKIPK